MTEAKKSSLTGITVLVTRPSSNLNEKKEDKLSCRLRELGANVIEQPVLSLNPPASYADLDKALLEIDRFDWVVFASPMAVQSVIERMKQLNCEIKKLASKKIAAVGKSTCEFLQDLNIKTDFHPKTFNAESLVSEFPKEQAIGKNFFWPRTLAGKTTIQDGLEGLGAFVTMAEAYSSGLPAQGEQLSKDLHEMLKSKVDVVTFTSSQSVRNFVSILTSCHSEPESIKLSVLYPNVIVAVIGPNTALTASQTYGRADVVAREYTMEGLVSTLAHYFNRG